MPSLLAPPTARDGNSEAYGDLTITRVEPHMYFVDPDVMDPEAPTTPCTIRSPRPPRSPPTGGPIAKQSDNTDAREGG